MKKTPLVAALLSVFFSVNGFADSEGLKAVKISPGILCADNANKSACESGIRALMKAVNNYSSLNEKCKAKSDLRDKMDEKTRYQCDSASEISNYLDGLQI